MINILKYVMIEKETIISKICSKITMELRINISLELL